VRVGIKSHGSACTLIIETRMSPLPLGMCSGRFYLRGGRGIRTPCARQSIGRLEGRLPGTTWTPSKIFLLKPPPKSSDFLFTFLCYGW
jgi:hypothetical protein